MCTSVFLLLSLCACECVASHSKRARIWPKCHQCENSEWRPPLLSHHISCSLTEEVCAPLPNTKTLSKHPSAARRSALTLLLPVLWHDLSPSVSIGVNIWQNVSCHAENTHTHTRICTPRAQTWWAKTSACCRRPSSSSSLWDISVNSSVTSWETAHTDREREGWKKHENLMPFMMAFTALMTF